MLVSQVSLLNDLRLYIQKCILPRVLIMTSQLTKLMEYEYLNISRMKHDLSMK